MTQGKNHATFWRCQECGTENDDPHDLECPNRRPTDKPVKIYHEGVPYHPMKNHINADGITYTFENLEDVSDIIQALKNQGLEVTIVLKP
jgi:hypothetical protein